MGERIDRVTAGVQRRFAAARKRLPPLDHVWVARQRCADVNAGRLAAANAYYGFFAVFALAVVGFAVLGLVFEDNATVVRAVEAYLRGNLPQLRTQEVIKTGRQIGLVAVVGLVVAGVAWVEQLRSSQRALWRLDQQPGNPVLRWLVDLSVLVGLGLLLTMSVAISAGVENLLPRLLGVGHGSPVWVALHGSNVVLGGLVDLVLGAAVLAGVPRLRMSLRRLLPSALLFAVGLYLLKTVGKWLIMRTERNPAYQIAAGTVGLLVFMYLLHQVLLFAAALAATSTRGPVLDLAHRRTPDGATRPPVPAVTPVPAAGSRPDPPPVSC